LPSVGKTAFALFQSTPPRGGDDQARPVLLFPTVSIHAPARGRRLLSIRRQFPLRVSIHAPARGRRTTAARHQAGTGFNPRPRAGATARKRCVQVRAGVSIHAPARGRRLAFGGPDRAEIVSIHAPARGRHPTPKIALGMSAFQSTPPRGGDNRRGYLVGKLWRFNPRPRAGATFQSLFFVQSLHLVSIHAPARGRPHRPVIIFSTIKFQSTPPRGGDQIKSAYLLRQAVSIHAPARGRLRTEQETGDMDVSIHAPARGRPTPKPLSSRFLKFQSTPPRGGDMMPFQNSVTKYKFQSTPPRGGDEELSKTLSLSPVSIHAPARGRRAGVVEPVYVGEFQSTPPRGGDISQGTFYPSAHVSIHAPARGRPCFLRGYHECFKFQSTPPRGGDPQESVYFAHYPSFNPRPRAGATFSGEFCIDFNVVSIHAPARGRPAML